MSDQYEIWLNGEAQSIPERAASEAEGALRAAVYAYGSAVDHSVRDQIETIATHEGVEHWWGPIENPESPNALQCASKLLDRWFRWTEEPVLWRPIVSLANSSKEVRITLRPNQQGIEPAQLAISTKRAELDVGGERTAFEHGCDREQIRDGSIRFRAAMVDAARTARIAKDDA